MPLAIRPLTAEDIPACNAIDRSLPDRFGLEEGLAEAAEFLRHQAGLAGELDGEIVGYLTFKRWFPESTEISWLAVAKTHHRAGVGRALIGALESTLEGTNLLSVKTLADSHPSQEYVITREFCAALGFHRLVVFPELWGPTNPCLLMVKVLNT